MTGKQKDLGAKFYLNEHAGVRNSSTILAKVMALPSPPPTPVKSNTG